MPGGRLSWLGKPWFGPALIEFGRVAALGFDDKGFDCGPSFLALAAFLLPASSASGMSVSADMALLALLCRLALLGATVRVGALTGGCVAGLGGPGAMATTVLTGLSACVELVGVFALVPALADPAVDFGESDSFVEFFADVGVVAEF